MNPTTEGPPDHPVEVGGPSTSLNPPKQRQQQPSIPNPAASPTFAAGPEPTRPSSPSGSVRSLRRVSPRLQAHHRSASINLPPPKQRETDTAECAEAAASPQRGLASADIAPALSEAETEASTSTTQDQYNPGLESYWPPRSARVSPRTASAIRWALEEALRKPFPFTPDYEELNASMSELGGGIGGTTVAGGSRAQNGTSRPSQGLRPGTQVPAGVRTPTDIMRDRRDREARRKAEQEAREREQQEAELRQRQEQEHMQHIHSQQYAAAGVAGRDDSRTGGPPRQPPAADQYSGQQPPGIQQQPTGRPDTQQQPAPPSQGGVPVTSQQPPLGTAAAATGFPQQQQPESQARTAAQPTAGGTQQRPTTQPAPSGQTSAQTTKPQEQPRRSAFPHAFERWETLSSHWEGLTGYWIRKLEQNNKEISQDPLSQQMARQINDLSAAGANLFHAVVELQRLRASSERKFQRWFFDTRAEQERAREVQAELERQIRTLKMEQADAVNLRMKAEAERKKAEELLKEMRRELQISKEEARRAWEELGRREQEERERTASLRNGEPTIVGGVQVVPMIPGAMSRQNSTNRPPTRDGPHSAGAAASGFGGQQPPHSMPPSSAAYYEEAPRETESRSQGVPTSSHPSRSPGQPAYAEEEGRFYQHEGSALHGDRPTSEPEEGSYVGSVEGSDISEEAYVRNPDGSYAVDSQGRRLVYTTEEEYHGGYGTAPARGSYGQDVVDYSGSGWGGWESITPRHRHPTRLSDVLEEDEPSRTSPSRASQASHGMQ